MKNILLPFIILLCVVSKSGAQTAVAEDSVPLRVSHFNVAQNNDDLKLNWKVVCNLRYANFQVQRSINGRDYTTINNFTADKIRCLSPFYLDDKPGAGRFYYRLKVGDKDGYFSTSNVVVAFGKEKSFEINSLTPNLITSEALLSISSAESGKASIAIVNMQGYVVKRFDTNLNKGLTNIKLDASALSAGIYTIRLTNSAADFRLVRMLKL